MLEGRVSRRAREQASCCEMGRVLRGNPGVCRCGPPRLGQGTVASAGPLSLPSDEHLRAVSYWPGRIFSGSL